MECALALLCYIFCVWNKLWRYCIKPVEGPRMKHTLAVLCYKFRMWIGLWCYCVILAARVTHACAILSFSRMWGCAWNAPWHYYVIFSVRGTLSDSMVLYIFVFGTSSVDILFSLVYARLLRSVILR